MVNEPCQIQPHNIYATLNIHYRPPGEAAPPTAGAGSGSAIRSAASPGARSSARGVKWIGPEIRAACCEAGDSSAA